MKVVGLDEAGCGSLMGPLVASAVLLIDGNDEKYNDSKTISDSKRRKMFKGITMKHSFGIGIVTSEEIDSFGMAKSRRLVFHRALDSLVNIFPNAIPELIIVDGTIFENWNDIKYECIPKADSKYSCVSAASIVAKVIRDDIVLKIKEEDIESFEKYGWGKNKGYPTKIHKDAIKQYGITRYHRKTFKPCSF